MLTQSKDMAEKQNSSRTWYISLKLSKNLTIKIEISLSGENT